MKKSILLDIEGTIGSVSFVKDILFPYSYEEMDNYLKHLTDTTILNDLYKAVGENYMEFSELSSYLKDLIIKDKKIPILKKIQGQIWEKAYKSGSIKSHLYEDAYKKLILWYKNYPLYIYSSGSIHAQKLYFHYNQYGNLQYLFDGFFDTNTGPKTESNSYKQILLNINTTADKLIFFTDNINEYKAAETIGIRAFLLDRYGLNREKELNTLESFNDLDF